MPPQVSKKAVTTKRSARRNDHHESRKNITVEEDDEDMAETDDADIAEAGDSQSTTQSRAKSSDLGNLMVNMVQAQEKRHAAATASVRNAYRKSVTDTKETIAAFFDKHEAQASQDHKAQIDRLRQLLQEKARIEAAMQKKAVGLRESYGIFAGEFQTCLEERAKLLS